MQQCATLRCSSRAALLARPVASRPRITSRKLVAPRASWDLVAQIADAAAQPGDVNAPISVAIGAGIVVALAGTLLVPLALSPGQKAADKIFDAKEKKPLDKNAKKPAKKK